MLQDYCLPESNLLYLILISAAVDIKSSVFWFVTQRKWFKTDVSGLKPSPESSVSNHLTLRKDPNHERLDLLLFDR